jgi:integrase
MADKAFDIIRDLHILETRGEHFLRTLEVGCLSTNSYLRRLHNFALDMGWLPWPVLAKKRWPALHYREKRGVTKEEHDLLVSRESNAELRAFFWCCWHLGGSQSDVARLKGEDVDWQCKVVSFFRAKTGVAQIVHFGEGLAAVLKGLPTIGPLFPRLAPMDEKHRASLFQRACRRVKVSGISLHSYRYAWAERARKAGYPERFAQEALGHGSKAIHRAYAKKAKVELPPLEDYEKKIIRLNAVQAVDPTEVEFEKAPKAFKERVTEH